MIVIKPLHLNEYLIWLSTSPWSSAKSRAVYFKRITNDYIYHVHTMQCLLRYIAIFSRRSKGISYVHNNDPLSKMHNMKPDV